MRRLVEHPGLVQNTNVPLPEAGKNNKFIEDLFSVHIILTESRSCSIFIHQTLLYFSLCWLLNLNWLTKLASFRIFNFGFSKPKKTVP